MVEGADALLKLAQFAIALAGFIGVVVVLRAAESDFHPLDALRMQMGLTFTLAPAFLALLPAGLSLAGLSGALLWRLCGSLGAISVVVGYVAFEVRGRRRLPPAVKAMTSLTVLRILSILGGISFAFQVINISGLWLGRAPGLYFLALVLALAAGAMTFVRMVFIRPRGPERPRT